MTPPNPPARIRPVAPKPPKAAQYKDIARFEARMPLEEKLAVLPWGFVALVACLSFFGVLLLYSAGGAQWQPWAATQLTRVIPGLFLMIAVALTDIRFFYRWSWVIYAVLLASLVGVEVMGHIGMGAKRWLNFGYFVLQPSEHMKVALALVLARYFHELSYDQIGNPLRLIPPVLMVIVPAVLILLQPNLGTAMMTLLFSAAVFFLAGVRWWKFAIIGLIAPIGAYFAWGHLHDYQKKRLTTFLDPSADPQGAGYNIIQSKIALGSGGLFGKGFAMGTQSQLNFLPEKHTDFIFVVLAEEFGLVGACILLGLFFLLIFYGYAISLTARSQFARLLGLGLTTTLFLYIITNVSMVMGLIPVVGIPLPLISYGGSVMLAFYIACGLILSIAIHKDVRIGKDNLD